ncbi:MAG: hypothetical protein HOO91_01790 [Bacteroidales bacterium]|nr:hypothetical protein [Bacteroidales bacterium]
MKQVIFILMATLAISCNQIYPKMDNGSSHELAVEEVIQASGYTYLKFTDNDTEQWLATTTIDAKVGEKYYYEKSMVMENFHSKELNRDFKTILFVDRITTEPISGEEKTKPVAPGSAKAKAEKMVVVIEKSKDDITVANLYSNKETYANKLVLIKGKVVKYSPEIMNKNWIHIQDGTEYDGNYDLTVTTLSEFKVGDIVTLEGKIVLDKDFGYGYIYDVLLEDAVAK